jgi:hypothetical protein
MATDNTSGPRASCAALGRQADATPSTVLLKYAPKDDSLVDSRLLVAALGNITTAIDGLLQDTEMELSLPTYIILCCVRLRHKGFGVLGIEDLGSSEDHQS